ncbi:MAG: hypothetical protein Q7J32_00775 [Sphingomonadaceae bacterium]|nr:hypothetical protein [Sphingomonadaceae bacterium]
MTEGRALILTGVAHLALLAGLSLTWSMQQSSFPSFSEAVPVEIVEISDVPRITEPPKPSIDAAPQEMIEDAAPEISPTEAATVEPEPAPEPVKLSPVPAPEAKPKPLPEPKKPAPPKAEAKPKAVKKAETATEAQELSSLIDKALPKARRRPVDTSDFAKTIEKSLPKGAQLDARATATLEQAIRAQVAPCWNPPIGGEDVRSMTVLLRIQLNRGGAVTGAPEVLSQTGVTAGNQAYARAFAESARRAVIRCSPLQLPAEYFDSWKLFELNFDPSKMT